MVFAFAEASKFNNILHKIGCETLCVTRLRLETYLIRFQSRPDSILDQFSLQNGRRFRVEAEPGSVTAPKRDTKGRLDLIWNRFGNVLGPFLVNILIHEPALTIEWHLPIRHRAMGALWTCASGHVRMDMCV